MAPGPGRRKTAGWRRPPRCHHAAGPRSNVSGVIPGRREAAGPESSRRSIVRIPLTLHAGYKLR
jgi:hypothetical protein